MSIHTPSGKPAPVEQVLKAADPEFVQMVTRALRSACEAFQSGFVLSADMVGALQLPADFEGQNVAGADFTTRIARALAEGDEAVLAAYGEASAFA